jgi:hypothetical protein
MGPFVAQLSDMLFNFAGSGEMISAHMLEAREMASRSRSFETMTAFRAVGHFASGSIVQEIVLCRPNLPRFRLRPVRVEPIHQTPVQPDREVPPLGDLTEESTIVDRTLADFGFRYAGPPAEFFRPSHQRVADFLLERE